jgi:hypothetical protein
MKTVEENTAALQAAIEKIKNAEQAAGAAIVPRPRDVSGRFTKKAKLTKAQKSTLRLQNILTKKDPETGLTIEEKLVEHLVTTAMECGPKDLMAAAKTYATVEERAWGRVAPSEAELNENIRNPVLIVHITDPPLPCQGELKVAEPLRPSFGDAPYIDAELISTNPQLTAEQMDPYKPEPKKPEVPEKKIEEPEPCSCQVDSPPYCVNLSHRPLGH